MGSFSEKCGLSGLPINGGDPVVSFIIDPSDSGIDDYQIACPPLYGTYNDYGSVELDKSKEAYHKEIMKAFFVNLGWRSHTLVHEAGMSSNYDEDYRLIDVNELSLKAVVAAFERGKVYSSRILRGELSKSPARQMFFHVDVLDKMNAYSQSYDNGWDTLKTKDELSLLITPPKKDPSLSPSQELMQIDRWHREIDRAFFSPMTFLMEHFAFETDASVFNDIAEGLYLTYLTQFTLGQIGKSWHPSTLPGAQIYDVDPLIALYEISLTKAREEKARWEEENYDEDDE